MRESGKTVLYGGVSPGMLYDAKTDQIMMDKILWHDIVIKNMSIESTRSEWKVQHDLYDRSHLFDLEASLKMSFMAGLVKVKIMTLLQSHPGTKDQGIREKLPPGGPNVAQGPAIGRHVARGAASFPISEFRGAILTL